MRTQQQTIDWEAELPLHREWMMGLARSRLGDLHACEDVVQDVILGIVRRDPQLDDPNKVRSWLYQAVTRRVADHLRRQYRKRHAEDELYASEETWAEEGGWDWILANEQQDLMEIAIARLPELEREIILLKFTQNWSYKKLGERLQLTERSVEYRLVRAKEQLRAELQRLGNEHA